MSFSETIFLFFLALIIFGPKKLPEIARQAGKLLNEFRRASNEFKAQIEQEIAHLEVEERKKTILPPSPPVEGTASRTLSGSSSGSSYPSYRTIEAAKPAEPASDQAAAAASVSTEQPVAVNGKAAVEAAAETISSTTSQESHA
ncbi:MAG TPA: twin-arginine translocase TatA/TatE family subunit [Candidatus Sulfotelmatobacter sp.]|nr:twin-arginine translocase TatA/TatE family subunit [Candidatus Sulfotelmatobacter sp.]